MNEFYQKEYIKMINSFEEKDYITSFLNSLILIQKLPYSKKIFQILGESLEKIGFIKQSRRCYIIGLHIRPLEMKLIDKLLSFIEIFEPKQLDEMKYKKLMIESNDFDLNYYFFKKLLNDKEYESAYKMIIPNLTLLNHFKMISEDFLKINEIRYSILTLKKGILIYPNELYYPLYELYLKKNDYFQSFKCLLHYSYFTNIDDYFLCGEYLEKINLNYYSLLCYYKHYLDTKNEKSFEKIKKIKEKIETK